ncbi:MAG: hypothetical protein U0414_18945 [Polyangiaceae bacterium]
MARHRERLFTARPNAPLTARVGGVILGLALGAWGFACRDVATIHDDGDGTTVGASVSASASSGSESSSSASTGTGTCEGCGTYQAINLVTGAPRMALLKRDDVRDLCFQLVLIAGAGSVVDLGSPPGGFAEIARVTHDADDCEPWVGVVPPPPMGEVFDATSLGGKLSISQPPCTVEVDAVMTFTNGPEWAPAAEELTASGVVIEGGCP